MHVTLLWMSRICTSFKRENQHYVFLRQNKKLTELNECDGIKKGLAMFWQGSISLMARFTLLITEWKTYTQESWNRIKLEWFTCRPEMQRERRTLMLCHNVQREPPCFLNFLRRIRGAGSNLSLRLGQKLICNGIVCTISIVILSNMWIDNVSLELTQHAIILSPRICHT